MNAKHLTSIIIGAGCILMACAATSATSSKSTAATAAKEAAPSTPMASLAASNSNGYLADSALPNSAILSPPAPASGSAEKALDDEISRAALALNGSPRWELATRDAVLAFPALAQTFSCALNIPMDDSRTPKLMALLKRAWIDAARVTQSAKQLYQRPRPFMENGKPTCTPNQEEALRHNGSYPSGHAAIGWSLGLILSEVSPGQTDALIARGRAFAQSRVVCNVHWQSDVREGQMMGSAVVARLNAEPAFRSDVEAAQIEVAALRSQGLPANANCEAEAQALKK
jgi:acid phosphatase (class A)